MEIIVGKNAGFCGGVLISVTKAIELTNNNEEIYCLGELVHNRQVIDKLKDNGLVFIDSLDEIEDGSKVIIRAHGISKEIYDEAENRNIAIYDLTCPKVLRIHEQATKYVEENYFIVLVAHKTHPEVVGTISFCGQNSLIVESLDDVEEAVNQIKKSNNKKVVVIAQTTFSMDLFDQITDGLKKKLEEYEILVDNTICNATETRQKEIKELAKKVDAMIIIGGKNSSNTKKLYDVSKELRNDTYLVETIKDLDADFSNYNKVGIMAGASTPKDSIEQIIKYLGNYK